MKNKKFFLILPLLISLCSCNQQSKINNGIIDVILDGVNVKATGVVTVTYPDEFSYLNNSTNISINRDYCKLVEDDGSISQVVRENTNGIFTTYFADKDGATVKEVYNIDNSVTNTYYRINGNKILFSEQFANPFVYVDYTDIDDNYCLNTLKANLIIEQITGYQVAVKKAQLEIKDGKAVGIDFEIFDRIDGLEVGDTMYDVKYSYTLEMDFAYDISSVEHLQPRTLADETIKLAMTNKTNFTMTFASDATTANTVVYVTDDAIFAHNNVNQIGLSDGDMYYKKISENQYDAYIYRSSSKIWSLEQFNLQRNSFLPDLEKVSPNLFIKQSDNVYQLDNAAAYYGLEKLILPTYAIQSGLGVIGTVLLENGNISQLSATFNSNSPFQIIQEYYDYGTTSMPSWLDASVIV